MAISFSDSLEAAQTGSSTASTDEDESGAAVMSLDDDSYLVAATSEDSDDDNSTGTEVVYASDDDSSTESWTKSSAYLWYDEYEDDNVSVVDELKSITVNDYQINLTQETNSQFIPFVMNRYYDGVDLSSKNILIHYVTAQGAEDYASPINVSYSSSQIKFGWLVSSTATAHTGELEFEIQAIGTTSKGDEYIWKTKPNGKLNILKSLEGDGVVEPDSTWITSFLTQVTEQVALAQEAVNSAEAAASSAQEAATNAQTAVDEVTSAVEEAKTELATTVDESISSALVGYYTKTEVDGLLEDIDLSAVYEAINGIDDVVGKITATNSFTIVDTTSGTGSTSGWGLLKSYQTNRNGWINLDYTNASSNTSSSSSSGVPYVGKVTTAPLNIRKGAGTNYSIVGQITTAGSYTIVEEVSGTGSDNGWGLLKSYQTNRGGWISLDYVTKV